MTARLAPTSLTLVALVGLLGCAGTSGPSSSSGSGEGAPAEDEPVPEVPAPGSVRLVGGKVGYYVATRQEMSGLKSSSSVAIVGEGPEGWHVEQESSSFEGFVMGLVVDKHTGWVKRAVLGRPKTSGTELAPGTPTPPGSDPGADAVEEEVEISIGSFPSNKVVHGDHTTWSGTEGELEGVVLKSAGSGGAYELAQMPESATLDLGGVAVEVTKYVYSNGTEYWRTRHEAVACLQPFVDGVGTVKTVMAQPEMTIEVTAAKVDHVAQLKWD